MAGDDKALEFKHAHITGQAMRDHWGPIVDRIAAETADWRDEWIYDLITKNERLNAIVADRLLGSSVDHRTLKDIIAENERLREALGWFLNDSRFVVQVGGNPNVVPQMIEAARAALGETK